MDKQRSRFVGQIDTNGRQNYNEHHGESSDSFKTLQNSINSLSDHVKDLKTQNRQNESKRRFVNGKSQNNSNFGWTNRSRQNNPPPSYNLHRRTVGQNRGNNFHSNTYQNRSPQTLRAGANDFVRRNRQNNDNQAVNYNNRNGSTQFANNQGNWNQSVWGGANRHH